MSLMIAEDENIRALENIQCSITLTDMMTSGVYMCDCTGCSNGCFEFCNDGSGPTD